MARPRAPQRKEAEPCGNAGPCPGGLGDVHMPSSGSPAPSGSTLCCSSFDSCLFLFFWVFDVGKHPNVDLHLQEGPRRSRCQQHLFLDLCCLISQSLQGSFSEGGYHSLGGILWGFCAGTRCRVDRSCVCSSCMWSMHFTLQHLQSGGGSWRLRAQHRSVS